MEDRDKLLQEAYRLGFEYERTFRGCSQCVIAAIQDTIGIKEDSVFKSATGFAGGIGLSGIGPCGAFSGGVMVLSHLVGRERSNFSDPERIRFKCFDVSKKLLDKFVAEFGTIVCRDIQCRIFGRPYYLRDPDEFKKFHDAGAHDEKCPDVVGKAVRMAVELIMDQGLLDIFAAKGTTA
ncbi:MAG: C_GCAxxG_C_C family protein [Deltaproteobacteria bacterium]|nr:C_GCAxxG_C_C family protein [Deltaproteobacteria bacterium]MBW1994231.1 C_GCAxxG_C_C family protein [Deltaproteobacteria bacterium]MBW2150296.1 C_GCAxxG_C_C family protein [Deltaproteobacteria bacterium]